MGEDTFPKSEKKYVKQIFLKSISTKAKFSTYIYENELWLFYKIYNGYIVSRKSIV